MSLERDACWECTRQEEAWGVLHRAQGTQPLAGIQQTIVNERDGCSQAASPEREWDNSADPGPAPDLLKKWLSAGYS